MQRRTFLIGAASGLSMLLLSGCTTPDPRPTRPTPTPSSPLPRPAGMVRSRWASDSFTRGASSYLPVGSSPDDRVALREPVQRRVFFAGEATSSEHPNSVAGAQESGRRAADEVTAVADDAERIAIVGAGIAGAAAARQLTRDGFDVVVVEARDRTGGRIDTRRSDSWPVPVELGAAWVHDLAGTDVLQQLTRLQIDTAIADVRQVRDAAGAVLDVDPAAGAAAVTRAVDAAASGVRDVSVATALADTGASTDDPALRVHLADPIVARLGADPDELSAWFATTEVPAGADQLVTGGMAALIDDALDGIRVSLSSAVTRIGYDADGVNLRLATGESLNVDRVIVTVPLGVLQDGAIEFDPPLPFAQRSAIAALGVGLQDVVWLRFDEPLWSTEATLWVSLDEDLDITQWINLEPITGEAVLVGRLAGDAARRFADYDDDEAETAALESLRPFLEPAAEDGATG
ncbi:monoamine oxidase [Diaminobutyricimonas aerilata]|uniref:Monoamine oxidase n=2 Tax=Diaminobutyricimonas aerilata TaxID=1162967 RepID=A0A2M9CJU7_9MICO|nr:monoamine oxidase [Diaminobutyricimonas aerilata]